jgi:hypothetical protein
VLCTRSEHYGTGSGVNLTKQMPVRRIKMTKGPYTRLTIETQFVGQNRLYMAEVNQWDCGLDDMLEMFRGLLYCAGFSPDNIDEHLGECKCATDSDDQ